MAGYMPGSMYHNVNVHKIFPSQHSSQSSPTNSCVIAHVINNGITFLDLARSVQIDLLQWCGHGVADLIYGTPKDGQDLVDYISTRPATDKRGAAEVIFTEDEAIWIIDERVMKNSSCSNADFPSLTKLATRLPRSVSNSGIVYNNIPIRSSATLF